MHVCTKKMANINCDCTQVEGMWVLTAVAFQFLCMFRRLLDKELGGKR